jgi:hypothetical protein
MVDQVRDECFIGENFPGLNIHIDRTELPQPALVATGTRQHSRLSVATRVGFSDIVPVPALSNTKIFTFCRATKGVMLRVALT